LKVRDLIPGNLKRSKSYFSEFEEMELEDFLDLVKNGDKKAQKMVKLIKEKPRLSEKFKQGRF